MEYGRTQKSMLNMAAKFTYQIASILLTFISRTIFINIFGKEYLGLNTLFSDVLSWLSITDLGFGIALAYSFYKPLAENDKKKIAALMNFYKRIYRYIALAVAIIGVGITPFIKFIVNVKTPIDHMQAYYLLSICGVVVSYLYTYKTTIIIADQKEYIVTGIGIAANLVKLLLQIVVLAVFKNYAAYLIINVFVGLVYNIYASRIASRLYPYIKDKEYLDRKEKVSIFSNIKSVFVYKISFVLLNATDNVFVSTLIGTAMVGAYSNYQMIAGKLTNIFSIIFTSMTASVGNVIIKEGEEKRYEIFKGQQLVSFILSCTVVGCFVALANNFVYLWLGNGYILPKSVICIIALNLYMGFVFQPLWSYREATGIYQKTKWIMLICAAVNAILSLVLGKLIGIGGILLATFISKISTYGWYEPKLLFKIYFGKSSKKYFSAMLYNLACVILVTGLLAFISKYWMAQTWILLVVKGIVFMLASAGITYMFYRKNSEMQFLKRRLKAFKIRR